MSDEHQQEDPADAADGPRRYPSTIGGTCYLGVLAVALLGILLIWVGVDWRIGIRVLAGSLGAAAVLRLVLRERDAGMLAVRNRWLDVAIMLAVGTVLIIFSIAIPDQPV